MSEMSEYEKKKLLAKKEKEAIMREREKRAERKAKTVEELDKWQSRITKLVESGGMKALGEILFDPDGPAIIIHVPASGRWRQASADFLRSFLQAIEHLEDKETMVVKRKIIPIEKRNRKWKEKAKKDKKVYR